MPQLSKLLNRRGVIGEVNLLDSYPRIKRPLAERVQARANRGEVDRAIARKFGKEYFDGDRTQGYGGYFYDGRWKAVAKRMQEYYGLTSQDSILDVGCGKGFLLHDFRELIPGITVAGIDISSYAIEHTMEEVKPFCMVANALALPFPDKSFDLVISINVIHNLKLDGCAKAILEMERLSRKYKYVQVDSWRNEQERINLENWQLTVVTFMDTEQWKQFFAKVGYTGDFYWTITE